MATSRTSFVLEDKDRELIRFIKDAAELDSDASAIRYAIRRMAKILKKKIEKASQTLKM